MTCRLMLLSVDIELEVGDDRQGPEVTVSLYIEKRTEVER